MAKANSFHPPAGGWADKTETKETRLIATYFAVSYRDLAELLFPAGEKVTKNPAAGITKHRLPNSQSFPRLRNASD